MGRKFDIDENGNVFKVQEDGTILRVGKIDEDGKTIQKVKKPVQTNKSLNRAIVIGLIILWVLKIGINIPNLIGEMPHYYRIAELYDCYLGLSFAAILATIIILILLVIRKIKKSFGFVALLVSTYTVCCGAPCEFNSLDFFIFFLFPVIDVVAIFAIVVVALVYAYKFSLIEKTNTNS